MSNDPNPYTAQQFAQPTPSGAQKSSAPKILGIINIVFGVIGVLGFAMSILSMFIMSTLEMPDGASNPVMELMENSAGYQMFMYASIFFGAIFTVILFIAGFGLLNYRKYGRTFSIAYSGLTIVFNIGGMIANYIFLVAPMLSDLDGDPAAVGGAIGGAIGSVLGGCFGMVYPAILLFFMFRPNVVESLD